MEEQSVAIETLQVGARIRPTGDFTTNPATLPRKDLIYQFRIMRYPMNRSNAQGGQLKRRTRELKEAQDVFLKRMRDYEDKLRILGKEKVETMEMAKELHAEILSHERRQKALNKLLQEMDDGSDGSVGFLSLYRLQNLFTSCGH